MAQAIVRRWTALRNDASRSRRAMRTLVTVTALLVFVVIACSAVLRHIGDGLACSPRPACYGRLLEVEARAAQVAGFQKAVRVLHRIAASSEVVVVLALVAVVIRGAGVPAGVRGTVAVVAVVTVVLAVVGVATTTGASRASTLVNLLGGIVLFALLARVHERLGRPLLAEVSEPLRRGVRTLFVLIALSTIGGALVSTLHAGLVCGELVCGMGGGWSFSDLSLRTLPAAGDRTATQEAAATALAMAHRWIAVATLAFAIWVARRAREAGDARVVAGSVHVAGTLALQTALGIVGVLFALPLMVAVAHTVVAALLAHAITRLDSLCHHRVRSALPMQPTTPT